MTLPEIPDDDADFTPDLARKIIAKYRAILGLRNTDVDDLVRALKIFLGHDGRFQVAVGGNPNAVEKMLAGARRLVERTP